MKTTRPVILTAAVSLLAVLACSNFGRPATHSTEVEPEVVLTASPGETFELEINTSATLADSGIMLTFDRVEEDARCPLSVDCASAGGMTVWIALSNEEGKRETYRLSHNLGGEFPTATWNGVTVQFEDLAPYPEDFDPPEDPYMATFTFEMAGESGSLPDGAEELFSITEGETVALGETGVDLTFVGVTDEDRCPLDHDCEVPGSVTLRLELAKDGQSQTFEMQYYVGSALPSVAWEGVILTYQNVEPYPETMDPITGPYVVTLSYGISE